MKKILVHGLGHTAESWNQTVSRMTCREEVLCPDLPALLGPKEAAYRNLYASFASYCGRVDGPLALCGLSLGGTLALRYALDFPDRVRSLVLIGTPCQTPRLLLRLQSILFRLLPASFFQSTGFGKKELLTLGQSMAHLDFRHEVQNIQCRTLVLCGEKDRGNLKSAYYLRDHIQDAELKIIAHTGHVVNEENPAALADILNVFYSESVSKEVKTSFEPCGDICRRGP